MSDELPLSGGRKKADPRPRNDAIVRLQGRSAYYARIYLPGRKRAVYRSTYATRSSDAAAIIIHLRSTLVRSQAESAQATQTEFQI
jgi:hypothetical protein